MRVVILVAVLAVTLLSGCASIVSGQNQSVSVIALSDAKDVGGARCSLTNDKGQWFATTPGSVTVRRSFSPLAVDCKSEQMAGTDQIKSSTKGMAFGNILFGGVIGVGVDVATGAAYDYPDVIRIKMLGIGPSTTPTDDGSQSVAAPLAAALPSEPVSTPPATMVQTVAPLPVTAPSMQRASIVTPAAAPLLAKEPPGSVKIGQNDFQVRRLARDQSCHSDGRPILVSTGPATEAYTVVCANGDSIAVRCEYGNCRALK